MPDTPVQHLEPALNSDTDNHLLKDKSSNTSTESDDDIDPAKLVERYLLLQSRLYELQPELVQIGHGRRRGPKTTANTNRLQIEPLTPEASNILRKLRVIESDVLFDQDDANEKWMLAQNDIAKEVSERRKFRLRVESKSSESRDNSGSLVTRGSAITEETSMDMLGDLLFTLPEENTDAVPEISNVASTIQGSAAVTVREFGKWTGLNPSRILEEACKAR